VFSQHSVSSFPKPTPSRNRVNILFILENAARKKAKDNRSFLSIIKI